MNEEQKECAKEGRECEPVFLVSLIEHKSSVDYDVAMQLLRYMMCIWTEYRREMEALQKGITKRKNFRYPMIIPIVYYEGKAAWTADIHLKERISGGEAFLKWLPDFQYEVIRVHDYSNEELLARGDEMSLIMLVNKIQDAADLSEFSRLPHEEVNRIIKDSPGTIIDILASVIESLCKKIGATSEETEQCVRKVKEREMGYLFENMEKMNIQEERKKTVEANRNDERGSLCQNSGQIRLSYQGVVAGMTAFLFNKLTCKARRRLVLSQRILHTLYIFSHRPCGILAIFSHQLDDGGTHDSAV